MRIDCPDCGAVYEVPDAMISAGREVRCARCGRGWAPLAATVVAPAPRPAPPEVVDPPPKPPLPPPALVVPPAAEIGEIAPPASRGDGRRLAWAWSGSLALVALGALGLAFFHTEVAAAWPPAARLFRAMGLS